MSNRTIVDLAVLALTGFLCYNFRDFNYLGFVFVYAVFFRD